MTIPVIVEVGVNHAGDQNYADEYIKKLIEQKVYAVTFQVHSPQTTTSDAGESKTLEGRVLSQDFYRRAVQTLHDAGIKVGIAITDYQSVPFFASLGIDFFKTLGADITCQPLFMAIAATGKPVYVSTAYASHDEINAALNLLPRRELATLLYTDGIAGALGNTHLRTIDYFKKSFNVPVGYGKHSIGDDILIASLAFNPSVIFIYVKGERAVSHPDDAHAVLWDAVSNLVSRLNVVEQAYAREASESVLAFTVPEKAQRQRRRLIASAPIKAGEQFTAENLAATRPAGEVSAKDYTRLIGVSARQSYEKGESIAASELLF